MRVRNPFLRYSIITLLIIAVLLGLLLAFLSPIAKYLVEKNGEKYTGRKIEVSWIYLNPFTGFVHASGLLMHEQKDSSWADSTRFLSIGDLDAHISIRQLIAGTVDISSVTIDRLHVNVLENHRDFNFDDLFKRDTTKINHKKKSTPHYYIHNITLMNSEVQYKEVSIPVHFWVKKLDVQCPAIQWDSDTASFNYRMNFMDNGGEVKGLFSMNFHSLEYHFHTLINTFDLSPLDQYIKEFSKYGYFTARMNADFNARGYFRDVKDLLATGKMDIDNFHFGKSKEEDYLRFHKLTLDIDSLSPLDKKYFFKKVFLDSLYIKYERYDSLDNFTHMFGRKGKNIAKAADDHYNENIIFQIAHYISLLAADIVNSDYRATDFSLKNAHVVYNDFALQQSFSASAFPIEVVAHNIDTRAERLDVSLKTNIYPFGHLNAQFNADPGDFGNFGLTYQVSNLPVPWFNPYSVTYTSYPFNKGTIGLSGTWMVQNKNINSQNHILVINPTLADKVKIEDAKKEPMHIIMFLVRELNRKIDVNVPIKGDLNNPKFSLTDEIIQVLKNIVIKPAAYPFVTVEKQIAAEPVNQDILEWKLGQTKLDFEQKKLLRAISRYLFFHPKVQVVIEPRYFASREKESLLLFEAKRKYYMQQKNITAVQLTEKDTDRIEVLSIKDPGFDKWLNKEVKDPLTYSIQAKSLKIIGSAKLDKLYKELIQKRQNSILAFLGYLQTKNRLKYSKVVSEIPQTGFSHEFIDYKDAGT